MLQGRGSQFLSAIFVLAAISLSQPAWSQTSTLPLAPSDWNLAYSGQDATLSSVTYAGQPSLEWQVTSALGHSDWAYDTLSLPTDEMYTFTVQLAEQRHRGHSTSGMARPTSPPLPSSSPRHSRHSARRSRFYRRAPSSRSSTPDSSTSAVTVYFTNPTVTPAGPASGLGIWQIAYGGQDATLTSTNYQNAPALEWQVSSALGHSDWIYTYPPFVAGQTYKVSADVAGNGTAAINVWDGNENVSGPPVTLTPDFFKPSARTP